MTKLEMPDPLAATAYSIEVYGRKGISAELVRLSTLTLAQRTAGRTGGGMACPACGARGLIMLDEERAAGAPTRMRCGNDPECGVGVSMRVRGGAIVLKVAS